MGVQGPGSQLLETLRRRGPSPSMCSPRPLCTCAHRLLFSGFFEYYGIASTIKWPNDIIVDGEKCAGFLCEQLCPDRVLIGVGINVAVAPPGTSKAPAFAKHLDPSTQTIDLVGYLTNELLAAADIPDSMALELYSQACTTIGRQYQHAQYGP